jgi:glycosyltransferase involved in cell wall biosynthesis
MDIKRKPRILWVGEATFLKTGYSVYGHEVLKRLHATGKYEIAELGGYADETATERFKLPWTFYGNAPVENQSHPSYNDEAVSLYRSQNTYQFGEWRFEDVCLDFRPDIVMDIRDHWMHEFIARSPFRPHFKWLVMPTIDSAPQQEQWLATYLDADIVTTYSQFGKDCLEQETNGSIKVADITPPGADLSAFKPVEDKEKHKEECGLDPNCKIVGTVMRNQVRKLFPDLFKSFADFGRKHPDIAENTFLYAHTAWPDLGWDIPSLLRENDIGHRVLFTYVCQQPNCKYVFPSFFQGGRTTCQKCHRRTAKLPTTQSGVNNQQLAAIYNWFDVYVQYSVCEGFGMPQVEAASCGVPVMAVDYSAMQSVVKDLKGTPIDVQRMFRDANTQQWRALPDNDDFVEKLAKFLSKPTTVRRHKGREAYNQVLKKYNYDITATKWEAIIDGVELREEIETWDSPPRLNTPNTSPPRNMNPEQLVHWAVLNTWGEPDQVQSYVALRMLRDLQYGSTVGGTGGLFFNEASHLANKNVYHQFLPEHAIRQFYDMAERRNTYEKRRVGMIKVATPSFVKNKKEDINGTNKR